MRRLRARGLTWTLQQPQANGLCSGSYLRSTGWSWITTGSEQTHPGDVLFDYNKKVLWDKMFIKQCIMITLFSISFVNNKSKWICNRAVMQTLCKHGKYISCKWLCFRRFSAGNSVIWLYWMIGKSFVNYVWYNLLLITKYVTLCYFC